MIMYPVVVPLLAALALVLELCRSPSPGLIGISNRPNFDDIDPFA